MTQAFKFAAVAWVALMVGGNTELCHAQVAAQPYDPPAGNPGFQLPDVAGTLNYSFSVSETVTPDYQGTDQTVDYTNLSGHLAYLSRSVRRPFSMVYTGGYLRSTAGQPSTTYQRIALSQVFQFSQWSLLGSATVDYRPRTSIGGLSGVAGAGDVGVVTPPDPNEDGLQSNYGTRLTTSYGTSLQRKFTGRTSGTLAGSFYQIRFPGSVQGIDSRTYSANGSVEHAISARTSFQFEGSHTNFGYPQYHLNYVTESGTAGLKHQWTARLVTSLSGGPQYTATPSGTGGLNYGARASATYTVRENVFGINFDRGVNTGSGITTATRSTALSGSALRRLGHFSNISGRFSYRSIHTLDGAPGGKYSTNSLSSSVQFSRTLTRTVYGFVSYTYQRQLPDNTNLGINALRGDTHTVGVGFTYTPRTRTIGTD